MHALSNSFRKSWAAHGIRGFLWVLYHLTVQAETYPELLLSQRDTMDYGFDQWCYSVSSERFCYFGVYQMKTHYMLDSGNACPRLHIQYDSTFVMGNCRYASRPLIRDLDMIQVISHLLFDYTQSIEGHTSWINRNIHFTTGVFEGQDITHLEILKSTR